MTDLHLIALLKKHGWKLHTRITLRNWTKERLIDEIECLENNWGVSLEREEISFKYKKELVEENEQLKKKISYLEDNLRVARKDNEDLRNDIANGLKEFTKELPFTSLCLLANKKVKEENEKLKENIKNARKKLFDILTDYEIGNYDNNIHQFYKDVYDIHNELMELAE